MEAEEFSVLEAAFGSVENDGFEHGSVEQFLVLFRRLFQKDSNWDLVRELLLGLGDPKSMSNAWAGIAGQDRAFAESIAGFVHRTHSSEDPAPPRVRAIDHDFDFLDSTCFVPNLTPVQALNLLVLRRATPTKDAALVVTMRDEGLALLEWIAFYRAIGMEDIFVYSNDSVDGSEELLELLARNGVIHLIKSSIAPGTNPQRKAYQHALHLLHELRSYKWVFFLDADEFLVLDERYDYRIGNFVRHVEKTFPDSLPGAIVFPWDWRLSDLSFERTEGLLFERYPHSIPHGMVKSMTRLSAALGMCEIHIPTLGKGAMLVDSALEQIEPESIWTSDSKSAAGGSIAHFWGKSFAEFAIKKRRGDLLLLDLWVKDFKQYFEWTADRTAETLHPLPKVLLERMVGSLNQLKSLPGVTTVLQNIESRFLEIGKRIQIDSNLRALYEEMRLNIAPNLEPARGVLQAR